MTDRRLSPGLGIRTSPGLGIRARSGFGLRALLSPTFLLSLALLLFVAAPPLHGQDPGASGHDPGASDRHPPEEEQEEGWWRGMAGSPEPDRFYGGLWALHLRRMHDGVSAHHLLGATLRGFHAGTFVNTHDGRSFQLGVGRTVVKVDGSTGGFRLGYRAGILMGYDERLTDLAERWPAIPAAQLLADAWYRRLGVQVGWAWIVVSVGGFVTLDL